jgi:hypothetical protein
MQISGWKLFAFVTLGGLALSPALSHSQQPRRPAYDGSGAPDVAREIHVDQDCRILPDAAHPLPRQKAKPFHDPILCSLEGVKDSEHMEERIDGNELRRFRIQVSEQTFVLQNITTDHIVFVVNHAVPSGWTVDSDPQPNRYDNGDAVFPVHAQPGEIVRLHVGIRHTKELKPKLIASR